MLALVLCAPPSNHSATRRVTDHKPPVNYRVTMTEFSFEPESINVLVGDTVTWVNYRDISHTSTSGRNGVPDGRWDVNVMPDDSLSLVFDSAGTYPYYCAYHVAMGMKGIVVVSSP